MYDHFNDLVDSRELVRPAKTSYYWLGDVPEAFRAQFTVPSYDRDKDFVFLNENGWVEFYLLRKNYLPEKSKIKYLSAPDRGWGYTQPFGKFDVVFISNGEPREEEFYTRLQARDLGDRLHWVRGVKGRTKAYKEAARVSRTHHFFAVFGKLEVDPDFEFDFPIHDWDRTHYVFSALNPVNGLCYGHQGLILYDKEQVLANPGTSLDFTMGQTFVYVDKRSGVAHYNTSPLAAWRCAFREVLKLLYYADENAPARISAWLTGEGPYASDSIQGALDAQAYFKRHEGRIEALQLSYEWDWLEQEFLRSKQSINKLESPSLKT